MELEAAVTAWLDAHRDQAIYAVPAAAFAEACLGVGIFFPSIILVAICSFL